MGNRDAAIEFFKSGHAAATDSTLNTHDKLVRAYQLFASACMVDPTYGTAWYQLGNNNSELSYQKSAIASWRVALTCDFPDRNERARVLANLAWTLHTEQHFDEAMVIAHEANAIDPTLLTPLYTLSVLYGLKDDCQKSVDYAQKSFDLDSKEPQTEITLAFAQLFNRQFAEGLHHFERRFEWRLHGYLHAPYPRWRGEAGGTVYLMSDQGMGDTLSYARFVERACKRAKYVHAQVHPELLQLFTHAFVHIPNLNLIPQPNPFPQADFWTTFVSLPAALGLTDDEIVNQPHIACTKFRAPENWRVPDRKLHIGIAWAGQPLSDNNKYRSVGLDPFLELYRVPGIQLYSIQMDERSKDLYDTGCSVLVRDLKPYIRTVSDTVAFMQQLDLVICCESAPGHIAGLAGAEYWIAGSYMGRDYRIGHTGKDSIWYQRQRYFRQDDTCRWELVFKRITEALRERVDGHR